MIVLTCIILLIAVISSVFCFILYIDLKNTKKQVSELNNTLLTLAEVTDSLNTDVGKLLSVPKDNLGSKLNMIELKVNRMEDILSSFNNGFKYQESWMR